MLSHMLMWLEALGAGLVMCAGLWAGRWWARRAWPRWLIGYALPIGTVFAVGLARRSDTIADLAPVAWLLGHRVDFWLLGAALPMVFATLVPHLSTGRLKVLMSILGTLVCVPYVILPFVQPALYEAGFRAGKTELDRDGVCLQSQAFTCGPAASVTILRRLKIVAEEGDLAIRCRTSGSSGTPTPVLLWVLNERYSSEGVRVTYRNFDTVEQLAAAGPAVVSLKHRVMVDHFVAVLEITPTSVVIGDPLVGKRILTRPEFTALWRHTGLVFARS